MPFELIHKKNNRGFDFPAITVHKTGIIRFSKKASEIFGFKPGKRVRIFFNKKSNLLGFELLYCEVDINGYLIDTRNQMSLKSVFNNNDNEIKAGIYELYKKRTSDALVLVNLNANLR